MQPDQPKMLVKHHWEQQVCGSRNARDADGRVVELDRMAEVRYRLEPEILELARFEDGKDKRILEIGVGGGVDFEQWVRSGADATGVDLTEAGVGLTRQRLAEHGHPTGAYRLMVGDAENLALPDARFDIVYSWGVLHCSPDTPRTIREVYRVLKPGGIFRGMVYHRPSVVAWMLWLRHCLLTGKVFQSPREAAFRHLESPGTKLYTDDEMGDILRDAAFTDIEVFSKLSFGDLLEFERSDRYRAPIYGLIWKLYPRWFIRMLGDRVGTTLMFTARKPEAPAC